MTAARARRIPALILAAALAGVGFAAWSAVALWVTSRQEAPHGSRSNDSSAMKAASAVGESGPQAVLSYQTKTSLYIPGAGALIGDFTGDGRDDLVTLAWEPGKTTILVFSQLPDGSLAPAVLYDSPLSSLPSGMKMADMNEDGRQDVVLFKSFVPGVTTMLSTPGGGFAWREHVWIDKPFTLSPRLFDADGDGHIDVVGHAMLNGTTYHHHYSRGHLVVHYGDGRGNFPRDSVQLTGDENFGRWTHADFDGDGDQDLASYQANTGSLLWLRHNDGTGNFPRDETRSALSMELPGHLIAGDVNGDSRSDLLLFSLGGGQVWTFLQNAQGQISTQPQRDNINWAGEPASPKVVDLNKDGFQDLIYGLSTAPQFVYALGSPYGFQPAVNFNIVAGGASGPADEAFSIGDLNGDGVLDIATRIDDGIFLVYGKLTPYSGAGTLPGPPTIGAATLDPSTANQEQRQRRYTLPLTAPVDSGGNPITGYEVYSIPSGGSDLDAGSPNAIHRIAGLDDNLTYTFIARAITVAGKGPASVPSPPLVLGSVVDRDAPPRLTLETLGSGEGDLNCCSAGTVHAQLDKPAPIGGVRFSFSTSNGTATAGLDYEAISGSLVIPEGETYLDFYFKVLPDLEVEPTEFFYLNFSGVSGATLATPTLTVAVGDNDGPIRRLLIEDLYVTEADANQTIEVPIALTSPATTDVVFDLWSSPAFYAPVTPVDLHGLVIPAGQTRITVPVTIAGDEIWRGDRFIQLWILNGHGGDIYNSYASAFVIQMEDDPLPQISIADVTRSEGNFGTSLMHFEAKLSAPTDRDVSVNAVTEDVSAIAGVDYQSHYFAGLHFLPGETTVGFDIEVHEDIVPEADETFRIRLENPNNAVISDGIAVGRIVDDDVSDGIAIGDVSVVEGDAGTVAAVVTVQLSQPLDHAVSLDVATGSGTASPGQDFQPGIVGLLIPAGDIEATVTIPVMGDVAIERTETIPVEMRNVVGATPLRRQGTIRIINDDLPSISVSGPTIVQEGNDGSQTLDFVIRLSAPVSNPVYFDIDYFYGSADFISDYNIQSRADAFFDPGRTVYHHYVNVHGDTVAEPDEVGGFEVKRVRGALAGELKVQFTIANDDGQATAEKESVTARVSPSRPVARRGGRVRRPATLPRAPTTWRGIFRLDD